MSRVVQRSRRARRAATPAVSLSKGGLGQERTDVASLRRESDVTPFPFLVVPAAGDLLLLLDVVDRFHHVL